MSKKKENLRDKKIDELKKQLILIQEDLRVLKFKSEGAKSKNVKESLNLKKKIARILTEINIRNKNKIKN